MASRDLALSAWEAFQLSKLIVLDSSGGGLGDEICSEPVIRYACEQIYPPGTDIRICTKVPEVFKHLGKRCGANAKELGLSSDEPYLHFSASPFRIIDGVHTTHPFARIAQTAFIHAVDFHSMFMLRRILPDAHKQVHLQVDGRALAKILELVPDVSTSVLFHIGSTEQLKMFPPRYCQELIDALRVQNFTVVVFGQLPDPPELHGAVNLVNALDVEMTIALVAAAPFLITNDSGPLHIAAAFDNYLIAIPTIKHPDHIVHPRYGQRYWRAVAICKKLMVDDRMWPPEVGTNEWQPAFGPPEEYLPSIDTIMGKLSTFFVQWGSRPDVPHHN
jgi:hypothetical protein